MSSTHRVFLNVDGLKKLLTAINDNSLIVKVGIFSGRNARGSDKGPAGNAALGALHEFGSFSKGIPARSFLRVPIMMKAAEIVKKASYDLRKRLAKGDKRAILQDLGLACEDAVGEAFETGGYGTWAPNKPSTAKRKGSDKPLIDSGQLRRSILSKVDKA